MVRTFDKNIFVMLFAVMIGVVIVTYFMADIMHQSTIESLTAEHVTEIGTIEEKISTLPVIFLNRRYCLILQEKIGRLVIIILI